MTNLDNQIDEAIESLNEVMCDRCGGSGIGSSGDTQSTCDVCGGRGGVWSENSFDGIKSLVESECRKARINELTKADTSDEYYFKRLAQLKGQINV